MGKTKKTAAFGLVLGGAMTVGVAFAAWTAEGIGTGTAKAATVEALSTTKISGTVIGDLWPGGTGSLQLAIKNPNKFPVKVTSIVADGDKTITSTSPDCDGSNISLTGAAFDAITIPASSNGETVVIPGAVLLSETASTKCQGVFFTIPVKISGETTTVTTATSIPNG